MKDWNELSGDQQNDVIMFGRSAFSDLHAGPVSYEAFQAKYGPELALVLVQRLADRHHLRAVRYPDGLHFWYPEQIFGDVSPDPMQSGSEPDPLGEPVARLKDLSTGWPVLPFETVAKTSAKDADKPTGR